MASTTVDHQCRCEGLETRRLLAGGNEVEILTTFSLPENSGAHAVVEGRYDDLYIAGLTFSAGRSHAFLARYKSSGEQIWLRRYDVEQDNEPGFMSIAVGSEGDLYACGYRNRSDDGRIRQTGLLLKVDASGQTQWVRELGVANGAAADIALDAQDRIYVAGASGEAEGFLAKYTADGDLLWWNQQAARLHAVELDAEGDVYAVGVLSPRKLGPGGQLKWAAEGQHESLTGLAALAVTPAGDVYVAVTESRQTTVQRLSASGELAWTRQSESFDDTGPRIQADDSGNLFVAAWGMDSIRAFASDGETLWLSHTGFTWVFSSRVSGASGQPVFAGTNSPDSFSLATLCSDAPPAAPLGVTATSEAGQVRISWTDAYDATNYEIWRGPSADPREATLIGLHVSDSWGYADATAIPQQQYFYFIRGMNPAGAGAFAEAVPGVADYHTSFTVEGTMDADAISVGIDGDLYVVNVNGTVTTWYRHAITAIHVNALGGDDLIDLSQSLCYVRVYAEDGDDTILTGTGNDLINGGGGRDVIVSGAGNDTVEGGRGGDQITGGAGDDSLSGGDGIDTLNAGIGNDTVLGGNGRDLLIAGDGDDRLYGNGKSDTLWGGAGNDKLFGGAGADLLFGDEGEDSLTGGGHVLIAASPLFSDTLDGGDGYDRCWIWEEDDLLLNIES